MKQAAVTDDKAIDHVMHSGAVADRPRFERQIYTVDDKTWHWLARENQQQEMTRRAHTAAGHADSREAAETAANAWVAAVLRVERLEQTRENTPWETVDG